MYALPVADDTQTTIEMHMHEHAFWHVVHNKRNRLDACYDQNAKQHPHAYAFQL